MPSEIWGLKFPEFLHFEKEKEKTSSADGSMTYIPAGHGEWILSGVPSRSCVDNCMLTFKVPGVGHEAEPQIPNSIWRDSNNAHRLLSCLPILCDIIHHGIYSSGEFPVEKRVGSIFMAVVKMYRLATCQGLKNRDANAEALSHSQLAQLRYRRPDQSTFISWAKSLAGR
jgi:hypothetical protein